MKTCYSSLPSPGKDNVPKYSSSSSPPPLASPSSTSLDSHLTTEDSSLYTAELDSANFYASYQTKSDQISLTSCNSSNIPCVLFQSTGYVTYSALGSFFIPMSFMLFFYWRIYVVASRATRALKRGYKTTGKSKNENRAEERLTLRMHRGYICENVNNRHQLISSMSSNISSSNCHTSSFITTDSSPKSKKTLIKLSEFLVAELPAGWRRLAAGNAGSRDFSSPRETRAEVFPQTLTDKSFPQQNLTTNRRASTECPIRRPKSCGARSRSLCIN